MCAHFTRRTICLIVAAALLWQAPVVGAARAAMVTTETVLQAERSANAEASPRDRLMAFLRRQEVRAEMVALGVDPAEAVARVASLSDAEVAALVARLDAAPAGAGYGGGALAAALVSLGIFVVAALLFWFGYRVVDSFKDRKPAPPTVRPSDSAPYTKASAPAAAGS